MPDSIDDAELDQDQRELLSRMMSAMDGLAAGMPGVGICLFVFDGDDDQMRTSYIANTDRVHTLAAIREWVVRQEERGL